MNAELDHKLREQYEMFMAHVGECAQCRAVLEAFYAEMRQPHPLCHQGRQILIDYKEMVVTQR